MIIANAQALGGRCAMIDMEHSVDPPYWHRLGVKLDELEFSQPANGTQAMQIAETMLRSGLFSVIAVDSIASLVTEKEMAGEIGDASVAETARLMSNAMRILSPLMDRSDIKTNLLFTNQVRDKIGPFGGQTQPGGNAMKFYADYRAKVWLGAQHRIEEGGHQTGQIMSVELIKNKTAPPFRQARVPLIFGYGFDHEMELFDLGVEHGVITQAGAWFKFGLVQLGQGRVNSILSLRARPDLCYAIYDLLLTRVMAAQGFQPDGSPIPGFRIKANNVPIAEAFKPVDTSEVLEQAGLGQGGGGDEQES
jgi:recombination protein RecA